MKLERVLSVQKYKKRKRVGCGLGSGHGKTSTRGQKGSGARESWGGKLGFEGGQMPLFRRLPKRGFTNARFRVRYSTINVGALAKLFDKGGEVTLETIRAKGLVKGGEPRLKILGDGDVTVALMVKAHAFSASAKEKIEKAGGKAELLDDAAPAAPAEREAKSS